MSLYYLLSKFSTYIKFSQFPELARHFKHARAFTRERKLPLPSLVAVLLSGMRKSIQGELDEFFAHLDQQAQLVRNVSERAFRLARATLAGPRWPRQTGRDGAASPERLAAAGRCRRSGKHLARPAPATSRAPPAPIRSRLASTCRVPR